MHFASPSYGVHTALWWNITYGHIPELQYAAEMDFGWVKQNIAWRDVEDQVKGEYNTFRPDRLVEEAEKEGVNLLFRLDRSPTWATGGVPVENGPPENYQDFGDFCGWMAEQQAGRVKAYQVWNEPNLDREWGGKPPSPEAYTELLKVCYEAIKSADPDAIVISAGLAPTGLYTELVMPDDIFLRRMYEAGAADYFDVLGLNAPGYRAPPHVSPDEVADPDNGYGGHRTFAFRHVEDMREIMVEFGDAHKQVAILEMGWITNEQHHYTEKTLDDLHPAYAWYAVDEQTQADNLVGAYEYARENWQPWIGLMTTIYIADFNWWPETHEQWWWSIVRHDGTRRPAFDALKAMPKDQLPISED